jgi:hypothetical protein
LDNTRRTWVDVNLLLDIIMDRDTFHITSRVQTRRTYLLNVEKLLAETDLDLDINTQDNRV